MLAGILASTMVLASCGKGSAPRRPGPQTLMVTIDQMAYAPATLDAHVGDTVHWVNKDLFQHTATASTGAFDLDLKPGAMGDTVLGRPGTVKVACRYHPGMTMLLRVAG